MRTTFAHAGRRAALCAGAGLAALAFATPGSAQDVNTDTSCSDVDGDGVCEDSRIDASGQVSTSNVITVTGSRIRLPQIESRNPIFVVDEDYIEDRNITNVADALNELPAYRGSVTPAGAQGSFGQGVNFVNNLGLGSNRTLTLINGRRFVSSNVPSLFNNASQGVQVDLNVIPTILVDRIETIGVGGAPVYGSDAISGTTNVILKTRFDELVLTGTSGITEEGDNFRYNLSGAYGINFLDDRANITVAVSHDQEEGVLQTERQFFRDGIETQANVPALGDPASAFRVNPNIPPNTSTSDGIPPSVRFRNISIPFIDRGGVIFGGPLNLARSFDGNGNLIPFNSGVTFPGLGIRALGGDGFKFVDFGQITSDLRRTVVNAYGTFDVTPNVTLFAEGTYFNSRADELVQQPTFNTPLFGGASGGPIFSANNPFLTAQARSVLSGAGVTQFQISRASLDLADVTGFGENEIYRGVVGVRGEFNGLGRVFNFEVSANRGEADITTVSQDINSQNFINAVNVTRNAAGQIVCTTAPTRTGGNGFAAPGGTPIADPNCVPLNLFGEGVSSQAARDYVIAENESVAKLTQTVFNANIGSTLFDLYGAGPIGFNIGYEHREEEASFIPSEFQQQGLGRSVAIGPVDGKFNVDEVFGEILIPLIAPSNNFFIHSAELSAQGRYVDNTVNGGFFAWSAGGRIAPIPDIEFRGNFTKSFRAPAVTELFNPLNNAFSAVVTPCRPQDINNGPNPTARAANCAAFLAAFPNANLDPAISATIPIQSGGNPNLDNEEADSYTFGVIIRPRFLPRFALTVDYINIDIAQPIVSLGVADIVSGCFDNDVFNAADPANGNDFCSRIQRTAAGTFGPDPRNANNPPIDRGGFVINDPANPGVTTGFVNGVAIKFEGIQSTLSYSLPEDAFGIAGQFSVGGDMLYVRRRLNDPTGIAPSRSDGTIGDPEFSGQLRLRYNGDGFGASTFINYVGEQLFSRTTRGIEFREIDELDDYVTVNGSVFFDVEEALRVTLSVTNLFDRQGQEYFDTLTGINDSLGRRYAVGARLRF